MLGGQEDQRNAISKASNRPDSTSTIICNKYKHLASGRTVDGPPLVVSLVECAPFTEPDGKLDDLGSDVILIVVGFIETVLPVG